MNVGLSKICCSIIVSEIFLFYFGNLFLIILPTKKICVWMGGATKYLYLKKKIWTIFDVLFQN